MKWISVLLFPYWLFAEPSLLSLSDVHRVSLSEIKKDRSLVVVFQPDCSSCKKQIHDLSCLEKDHFIRLVGMGGSEKALRIEYRKMKTSYPAYLADASVLKALGVESTITPQIILWRWGKQKKSFGYKKCEEYRSMIREAQL